MEIEIIEEYALKQDLIIPAGTRFGRSPTKTERVGKGHIQAIFALPNEKDTSGEVEYYVGDMSDEVFAQWFERVE